MEKRILYMDQSRLAIIVPAPESDLSIDEIAKKDVPSGVPYQIVDVNQIPEDRTFRDAWEATIIPDGVGQ